MTKNNQKTNKNNPLTNLPIIDRIKAVKELFLEKLDEINQQTNEKTNRLQEQVEKQISILTENNRSQLENTNSQFATTNHQITNAHIKLDAAHEKIDSAHSKIDLLLENNQLIIQALTDLISGLLKNDSNAKTYNKIVLSKINESLNIHSEQFEYIQHLLKENTINLVDIEEDTKKQINESFNIHSEQFEYIQHLLKENNIEIEKIKTDIQQKNQLTLNQLKAEIEQQKSFQEEILTIVNQNQSLIEASQILNLDDVLMFSRNSNYQKNFQKLRENDIFIASYPRSGNTWVRLLLSDIILQKKGLETNTGGNCLPDIYKNDLETWNQDERVNQLPFRLIKTHEPYEKKYHNCVFIFRNPADVMTSFYYYQLEHNPEFNHHYKDINIFAKNMINQWCWHTKTYIKAHQNKSVNIQFISYEFMKENTINSLVKIADFCNLEVSLEHCQEAVNNQEFTKLQQITQQETKIGTDAIKQKLGFEEDREYSKFFRKGKVNDANEELSAETLDYIEEKAMKIYMQAKNMELLN